MLLDESAQVLAFHELHGDELHTIGVAEIVDANYISMGDLMSEQKLLLKPRQDGRIRGQLRANQLQRHRTVQLPVHGLVDGTHSAFAQQLHDLVAAAENVTFF